MYHVLASNPDVMGGGQAYQYMRSFPTFTEADKWAQEEARKAGGNSWAPQYIITQKVG